jgi:hypothetical protein
MPLDGLGAEISQADEHGALAVGGDDGRGLGTDVG